MPYRTFQSGRYVFISWVQPILADLDPLISDVGRMRRQAGQPLIMFSVIAPESKPPENAFRKAVVARWSEMMPEGETVHAILEGNGVMATLNRAALTAIRMFVRGRGIGQIYSSVEKALREQKVPP